MPETILVLGHNPGWENTVTLLSDKPVGMSPGNAMVLTIDAETSDWDEALSRTGEWKLECRIDATGCSEHDGLYTFVREK